MAQPEDVVQHLYLAVAAGACADADGRHGEPARHGLRDVARRRLQDDGERPRVLDGERVVQQTARLLSGASLHAVAAQLVDRLRREPEVTHDGDAGLRETAHGRRDERASLQLHGLRAALL